MRLVVALAIFVAAILFIIAVVAGVMFGYIAKRRATGIALVRDSTATQVLLGLLLATFSYWLAGKFAN